MFNPDTLQCIHFILQHLDRPGTYVRILFVDFSTAFNTVIPLLLQPKLTQLSVPSSICQWITSFLTDRQQVVRLGKYTSSTRMISTGAPQGCVLSPLLFSDFWANHWYTLPTLQELYSSRVSKRAGQITSSTLPLWTVTVWSTLQSSEHQNDQTQEQFLPSGNPSHEHLNRKQ